MTLSTYKVFVVVPQILTLPVQMYSFDVEAGVSGERLSREQFFEWLWGSLGSRGLVGVHEGTLLCDQAVDAGLETDAWLVDSGEAPRERDWVGSQDATEAVLFFASLTEAEEALTLLRQVPEIQVQGLEEQLPQDWDAEWKASFLNNGKGIEIPPFWKIVPPWVEAEKASVLRLNPGAGFGTGTHETTQLCLEAIGLYAQRKSLQDVPVLDFGSGSGILGIALARLGARVVAVEIDPLAITNAEENRQINGVSPDQLLYSETLPTLPRRFQVIVANILKPVLLEFAEILVQRLAPDGVLILSGLIEKDVEPVLECYGSLLEGKSHQIFAKNEWRGIRIGD